MIEKFIAVFVASLQKVKAEAIQAILCALISIFRTHLVQNLR
jgi:hypothetical protein